MSEQEKEWSEKYPLALPKNTVLDGRYVTEAVLGQGGFGITYVAREWKTKERVAIKEFLPDTLATRLGQPTIQIHSGEREESFRYGKECFLKEAQTLAAFNGNKNIVRVHTYFEENNTAYFVMDYVEGKSFQTYIKEQGGKISWQKAVEVLVPVMEALASVHSKGIIHRDVTPDNIYITADNTVKLLDFGAARYSLGDKSRSLDIVLKHGFAPKEQYTRHGRQGAYTDVYSLTASFYYAITGRVPPDSIDRMEEDDLVLPSSLGVDIPYELEDVLLKGMAVSPMDRYPDMIQLRDAMMKAVGKEITSNATEAGGPETAREQETVTGTVSVSMQPTVSEPVEERISPAVSEPVEERISPTVSEPVGASIQPTVNENVEEKKRKLEKRDFILFGITVALEIYFGVTSSVFEITRSTTVSVLSVLIMLLLAVAVTGIFHLLKGTERDTLFKCLVGISGGLFVIFVFLRFQMNDFNYRYDLIYNSRSTRVEMKICKSNNKYATAANIYKGPFGFVISEIGSHAFDSCGRLESISLGRTVEVIGDCAFANTGLKEIQIPDTVMDMGEGVFIKCKNLTSVTLSTTLSQIPAYTFQDCDALETILVPKNVLYIQKMAFSNCDMLKTVNLEGNTIVVEDALSGSSNASIVHFTKRAF